MSLPYRPAQVKPAYGGKLMTNVSSDEAGLMDYVTKRDWRRTVDRERRREGHDYFWPNTSGNFATDPGNQPFPNNVTATAISSITRTGSVATATFAAPHIFVEGETVLISGATQPEYNGQFVVSNVKLFAFDFTVIGTPVTPATGVATVKSAMPINLVHLARRPNGQLAVIVGTSVRIFRFFSLDDGTYADDYFEDPPAANAPYVETNPGDWIIIGNGYSVNGQRWEVEDINGYVVFNNGVDLNFTYRVEDLTVAPIYEMREQGISTVGTIAGYNGILTVGDVSEIQADKLAELFALVGTISGGDLLASQAANTVTTLDNFFTANDVGRYIIFADGREVKITAFTSAKQVAVDGAATTVTNVRFKTRVKFTQAGSYFSGSITGDLDRATMIVTTTAAVPSAAVGKTCRFTNGVSSVITAVTDATHFTLTLADDPGDNISALPFWIITDPADYYVDASAPIFDTEMVGLNLSWDSGDVRRIEQFISSTRVKVEIDFAIPQGYAGIDKREIYGRYTLAQFINRIQYRMSFSNLSAPRRWAASIPCSISAGSNMLTLAYPAKSFDSGQQVIILGAGVNGGNLTANILSVAANRIVVLDTAGVTTVDSTVGAVSQLDSVGAIAGSSDLEDDGSAILRMLPLGDTLVAYKDTSIFLIYFTGQAETPFNVRRVPDVPHGSTLFYRYTLVNVDGDFHLYAGANGFFRFDMASRRPLRFQLLELCQDIFFSQVTNQMKNDVFVADNQVTSEIVFSFPSQTSDSAILYDRRYGTVSTTSAKFTAANTPKRPEAGVQIGVKENWFLMGNSSGVILLYGRSDQPVPSWSGTKEIIYRREANPFNATKGAYSSVLSSGLSDFLDANNEKDIESYTVLLASQSANSPLTVELFSARNTAEGATILDGFPVLLTSPKSQNNIPVFYRYNYFQDRLTVAGTDNPCEISSRIWSVSQIREGGTGRSAA